MSVSQSLFGSWTLAIRLARRELRGGLGGFRIFIACLALGVAAIAAIGSFSRAVEEGLRADARMLMGGDVELRLTHRSATEDQKDFLAELGRMTEVLEMRTMARPVVQNGGAPALVQLKAVDDVYPLYGGLKLEPNITASRALERRNGIYGVALEDLALRRLGAKIGDRIAVGDGQFEVRAIIAREPDRGFNVFSIGPRLMLAREAMAATGLLQPGALVSYEYRLALPPSASFRSAIDTINLRFPSAGWRVRGLDEAGGGLRTWIDRLTLYLSLIGLAALLVGGVGIGNAVDSFLIGRRRTIASLKSQGAPAGLIWRLYLAQIAVLAALGIAIGLIFGIGLPFLANVLIGDRLPVSARVDLYWQPLVSAGVFGFLVSLLFALWPLAQARAVPAATLMRGLSATDNIRPRLVDLLAIAAVGVVLAVVVVATAPQKIVALWFIVGALGAFIAFPALGKLAMFVARRIRHPSHPTLRLALANLHRPGAATVTVMLSLGLGLTVLVATALIENNLQRQVQQRLPQDAPAFFFVDIQPDQVMAFDHAVRDAGGYGLERTPSLRGRISRIAGQPVAQVAISPDARWAVDSDRGLTYAPTPPQGSRIVAGRWWPSDYRGPPLVSFDANLARGFGIGIGDTITINILGRDIEARIANLRAIDWASLNMNFTFVFAPGVLEAAPQTWIATVRAKPEEEEKVYRAITERFSNVTVIRVKDALDTIAGLLGNIGLAARVVGAVSIATGLMVLGGAMAATQRRRVHDTVVMKVLGATRRRILEAFIYEFTALGFITAIAAILVGTLAAWLVITEVMNLQWTFPFSVAAITAFGAVALTLALGLAGTLGALRQRPLSLLRNE
jgi:putative ABC transport system permease protein